MVCFVDRDPFVRTQRVECLLHLHGFPGQGEDLRVVANLLGEKLAEVDPNGGDAALEAALTASRFLVFRMEEAAAGLAQSQSIPYVWVQSVAELATRGVLTSPLWCLVRTGVLTYGGRDTGSAPRWHLDGALLSETAGPFHELGTCWLLRCLETHVLPLARACNGNVELLARRVDSGHGGRWVAELRQRLDTRREREGWRHLPVVRVG